MVCNYLIRRGIAKYEAVYFVGDNQAINRVRVESYKTRNRGAFSGSLAALTICNQYMYKVTPYGFQDITQTRIQRSKVKSRSHHDIVYLHPQPMPQPSMNFLNLTLSKTQPGQDSKGWGHYGKVKGEIKVTP